MEQSSRVPAPSSLIQARETQLPSSFSPLLLSSSSPPYVSRSSLLGQNHIYKSRGRFLQYPLYARGRRKRNSASVSVYTGTRELSMRSECVCTRVCGWVGTLERRWICIWERRERDCALGAGAGPNERCMQSILEAWKIKRGRGGINCARARTRFFRIGTQSLRLSGRRCGKLGN